MAEDTLPAGGDWAALRRRFAGEALVQTLAFCAHAARFRRREGSTGGLLLTIEGETTALHTGPVTLLWQGEALDTPPDWPRGIPPDAARFFLTARPLCAPLALDLDLASRRDDDNPYYFTCYTQKRLRALLSRPEAEGLAAPPSWPPEGRALALTVDRFPAAVRQAAEDLDPYPVNRYALTLAGAARRFLRSRPTGGARPLLRAAETALGNALHILNLR